MANPRRRGNGGGALKVDDGATQTVAAEESAEERQQRLLNVSGEQLQREIAAKRKEIKAAKSAHGLTGQKVAKLNGELEDYLKEIDRREEAAEAERQLTLA